MKLLPVETSFWEGEENWALMLKENITIGYVWRKIPLLVVKAGSVPNIKDFLMDLVPIAYLEVDSLENELLKIDSKELLKYIDANINPESFTAEELWFNTNSI